ncbi:MAG TPA: ABC transporter substrate-binding protein [Candidatus Acidoferrum sp.]|nr:ABC transporter substrate-binding protein [Candidatus Acidoferrum sp.]
MADHRRKFLALAGAALALSLCSRVTAAQDIVVIATDTLTSTQRSIGGEKSVIKSQNPAAVFHEFLFQPGAGRDPVVKDSVLKLKPRLVLTVGSAATQYARDNFPDIPTVFCSVMYPVISGFVETFSHPGGNITGASLSIPADIQFRYFKQIIPTLKTLGVLYTDNTAPLIPPSKVVAKQMGLNLVAIKISSEKELSASLDSIAKVADGIWSVADANLFNPQSTKFILVNALRKGIPLMGFSRNVVESGALFALDFDYKAIGRQAGDLANQVMKGARTQELPVTTPDIIWFHYNEKTAQHMNITIPPELVTIAKEVYR